MSPDLGHAWSVAVTGGTSDTPSVGEPIPRNSLTVPDKGDQTPPAGFVLRLPAVKGGQRSLGRHVLLQARDELTTGTRTRY